MPQPDYENDLVFPPQPEMVTVEKKVYESLLRNNAKLIAELEKNKLHETHDWIKVALNRQNIIDELGGKLHKNDDHFVDVTEKLDIAVKALGDAGNYLTCMDDLSEVNNGKCNEQMALEKINEALAKIKENK